MSKRQRGGKGQTGAAFRVVGLGRYGDWPAKKPAVPWWPDLLNHVGTYPKGKQTPWGIPFTLPDDGRGLVAGGGQAVTVRLSGRADYLCFLHDWFQIRGADNPADPTEGLLVGEYELTYADGTKHVQPVRARFEVYLPESPGPIWTAVPFNMPGPIDPINPPADTAWGQAQTGSTWPHGFPLVYAMANPRPGRELASLTVRGAVESPLVVAALTLFSGAGSPLKHLPRRHYRVQLPGGPAAIAGAQVDMGTVVRLEKTTGPRNARWLASPYAGLTMATEPEQGGETLIEATGAADATLTVRLEGKGGKKNKAGKAGKGETLSFPMGQAFLRGTARAARGSAKLEVIGREHQWMQVTVRDAGTGRPTPARVHFSGPRGQYIAPYGHHQQINPGWFMDYGADVQVAGRNFAYVSGEFTTDMPVGDVYVEISKGFEYAPVRQKVTIRPGQKTLELSIGRGADWRKAGWVTADTHVHFVSPHTAALQAQGEGVNVVNLLASQWGRLFTNVGDLRGRVGVSEDDTIVYVGTENRNHMLGHMSMLGTQGSPVYPMCCGGPSEADLGDPDFLTMAQWAMENRRKGGVVIRPHFPYCGFTEDPVPVLLGLVDALEIPPLHGAGFPYQEWYRYLNCGYKVAVAGGTDKMGAYCAIGWTRTYAMLDPARPFDYDNWAAAMRAGRSFATTGPLIDLTVDGRPVGDTIAMSDSGGSVEAVAHAQCLWPMESIELLHNGQVVAAETAPRGARNLALSARVPIARSGWLAARCSGAKRHPGSYMTAHTSPVYVTCGQTRAFDGPAAEHMLALVEGGIEYIHALATTYDEASRRRMVDTFNQARAELKGRLAVEAGHSHHHHDGLYHTHGHGQEADHHH